MFRFMNNNSKVSINNEGSSTPTSPPAMWYNLSESSKGFLIGFHSDNNKKLRFSKKQAQQICHDLEENNSLITSVCIGPNLDKTFLIQILQTIAKLSNLKTLTLQFSVTATLPVSVMEGLSELKSLIALHVDNTWVTVKRQHSSSTTTTSNNSSWFLRSKLFSKHKQQRKKQEEHFNFASLLPCLPNLQGLSLTNCGLNDFDAFEIYKNIQNSNNKLTELSVAGNWRITSKGTTLLSSLNNLKNLNVTDCDLLRTEEDELSLPITTQQQQQQESSSTNIFGPTGIAIEYVVVF